MKDLKRPKKLTNNVSNNNVTGSNNRIFSLIMDGNSIVMDLADTYGRLIEIENDKRAKEVDNSIKLSKAETEVTKEQNRHNEKMIELEQEWEKINNSADERERLLSFIEQQIMKMQEEYDRYLNLATEDFLADTVTSRLDSLRKVYTDLTKEFIKIK